MKEFLAKSIVSLGGVGFIRPASATWGSLVAGIVLYFAAPYGTPLLRVTAAVAIFCFGWWLSNYIEKKTQLHDPYFVVIDELVGMMIVTLFLEPIWWHFVLAFIYFRIFDIAKLWPASIFDKRKGGFALMFDDVIMALPALLLLHLTLYV